MNSTIKIWNSLVDWYDDTFMQFELYDFSYDRFLREISDSGKVLELGCGPGNVTRFMRNSRPDLKILATDAAPEMVNRTTKNVPAIETLLLAIEEINQLEKNTFDGIFCGFCLPYISPDKVTRFVQDALDLLQTNGVVYISFIQGNHTTYEVKTSSSGDMMKVYFYDSELLTETFIQFGFQRVDKMEFEYPKNSGVEIHTSLIFRKG